MITENDTDFIRVQGFYRINQKAKKVKFTAKENW